MKVICVSCPIGCTIEVELVAGVPVGVSGHGCPRGAAYAREEVHGPRRVLTTSVRVIGGTLPLASVRTACPIPRQLIPNAMDCVRSLVIPAPVEVGQVVIEDLVGTGAALVATRTVPRRSPVDGGEAPSIIEGARNGEETQPGAD